MRPVIVFSPGIPQTTQSLHRQTFIRPLELVLRSHRSCEGLKILFVDSITEDLEWHETCMSDVANQFLIDDLEAGSLQLDIDLATSACQSCTTAYSHMNWLPADVEIKKKCPFILFQPLIFFWFSPNRYKWTISTFSIVIHLHFLCFSRARGTLIFLSFSRFSFFFLAWNGIERE